MLEVVVEDGNIANSFFNGFCGYVDQHAGAGLGVRLPFPAPVAAKGKTKQILDLAQLVAREGNLSTNTEEQSQMTEAASGCKRCVPHWLIREQKVGVMTRFCFQAQTTQLEFQALRSLLRRLAARREQKQIIRVAKIVKPRQALDLPVQLRKVDVGQQVGNGCAEGYAHRSGLQVPLFLK